MGDKTELIPLWEQEVPSICRFCAYAKRTTLTEDIYCEKKRKYQSEESSCKKFTYDILKKEVRRIKREIKKFSKENFEI